MTESSARIGLIGFGHVGRALARCPRARRDHLKALLGITALRDHPAGGSAAAASRLR